MASVGFSSYTGVRRFVNAASVTTLLVVVLSVLVSTAAPAQAASTPASDLFVTSPPDPILATPGTVATTTLTVGNIGHNPLNVRIITEEVELLDNGQTRFVEGPDPRFAGRIRIVPNNLSLPARRECTVQVSVNVPRGLPPDNYFLGFLVVPVINAPGLVVQNDIGALVILNVPGRRNPKLTAQYLGLPWMNLSFSDSASGFISAKSVGTSTLEFSTTTEIDGWPAATPNYLTVLPHLLPPGLIRDMPVHVSSWLGLGCYTFHTALVYNLSNRTTAAIALSRTVIVLNPLWLLVIPAIILFSFWRWNRQRRRKSRRRRLHRVTHSSPTFRSVGHASRP
jgi:hypothetical protein